MNEELTAIAKRIRREISDLDKIREHALRRWQKVSKDPDYLGSVGFDLQSFYQGVERVFQTIAKSIDRSVPSGEKWHKTLLEQMANEVSGIRPAVISTQAREALDNFRMFRHLAHNIYTFNLDPKRIKGLVDVLPGTVDLTSHDLLRFAEFLEQSTSTQDSECPPLAPRSPGAEGGP